MPNRRQHLALDRLAFGQSFPIVHAIMDADSANMGSMHRMTGHSAKTLDLIEHVLGYKARLSALLHILSDAKVVSQSMGRK